MMRKQRLILLLCLLLPLSAVKAQVLHGRVTDMSGGPLPYSSVYIAELRQGTTTNEDGYYQITIPAGTYSVTYQFLGYLPVKESIEITGSDIQKDIRLSEQAYEIPAVRVSSSGKDPAYFIMRKAIGMAPYHLNHVKKYKAEVYIKGGGKIDRLPKILRKQMNMEANEESIKEGQYYFSESVNMITFTAPDKYVHRVISSHSNMPAGNERSSPMDFVQASFYQPVLVEMAVSPLAPNAFSHYNFEFMGSTSQGDFVIDKIKVIPKRKSQQLFDGIIYIVEDMWAIHSLDLANENVAGRVRVKQLYTPVEAGIWMPVSHEFTMDFSMLGVKAKASYSSAVRYLEVEPDRSLAAPKGYGGYTEAAPVTEIKTETQKEIEKIFAKDELTVRDMNRLSRLNEKNIVQNTGRDSLEIKEKTTYIIEDDALRKDTAYWKEVRPIPLTNEEALSVSVIKNDTTTLSRRDSNTLTISVGNRPAGKPKKQGIAVAKALIGGKRWQASEKTRVTFDGLLNMKNMAFNTVDGLVLGTGMSLNTKLSDKSRLMFFPSVKYAFGRERLMWTAAANLNYNPMNFGTVSLRAGDISKDFSPSGVNHMVNSLSSLLFRENWLKLYNSTFVSIGHSGEIANGLSHNVTLLWEQRRTLENSTSFSLLKPAKEYTRNVPDNPFVNGEITDFEAIAPVNHDHISFTASLTYTPRQKYRIVKGAKINMSSDYPTFSLLWRHGFNHNDTLSANFDLLKFTISKSTDLGAMSEVKWRAQFGGFINRKSLQTQDLYFFNSQESPVLLDNYLDAFMLKPYYSVSSASLFGEAHIKYTNPCLLIKRLPVLSRTLMRENISLATLWTPEMDVYTEAGYSVSEIFFLAEFGIYAGFHNLVYENAGVKLSLRF